MPSDILRENSSSQTSVFEGGVTIYGEVKLYGTVTGVARTDLDQDNLEPHGIPLESWQTSSLQQLPATPSTPDLGIVAGTHGSATPSIQTEDLKAAGATTSKMRRTFVVPYNYVAGETIQFVVHAGMLTTVADVAATLDVEAFLSDTEAGVDGSDLCSTAAQDINSLTLADFTFTLDGTSLQAGDQIDIEVTVTVNDSATGTAVKAIIGETKVLLDSKG